MGAPSTRDNRTVPTQQQGSIKVLRFIDGAVYSLQRAMLRKELSISRVDGCMS